MSRRAEIYFNSESVNEMLDVYNYDYTEEDGMMMHFITEEEYGRAVLVASVNMNSIDLIRFFDVEYHDEEEDDEYQAGMWHSHD